MWKGGGLTVSELVSGSNGLGLGLTLLCSWALYLFLRIFCALRLKKPLPHSKYKLPSSYSPNDSGNRKAVKAILNTHFLPSCHSLAPKK